MLPLTAEETAFLTDFNEAGEALRQELMEFQRLKSNSPIWKLDHELQDAEKTRRDAEETRLSEAHAAHNARAESPVAIKIQLKQQLNAFAAKSLPGGELTALVEVANELLSALISDPNVIGTAQLLKTVALTGINALGDKDIAEALARNTVTRYTALQNAGLPEDFARQLILAEATRALALPSLSWGGRK